MVNDAAVDLLHNSTDKLPSLLNVARQILSNTNDNSSFLQLIKQLIQLINHYQIHLFKYIDATTDSYSQRNKLFKQVNILFRFYVWALSPTLLSKLIIRHTIGLIALYSTYTVTSVLLYTIIKYVKLLYVHIQCKLGNGYYLRLVDLQQQLLTASEYTEWSKAAYELDQLEGKHKWKYNNRSNVFDYNKVQYNVRYLSKLIADHHKSHDPTALMRYLRSRLLRNIGNIGDSKLYSYLRVGTKQVIEEYNDLVMKALEIIGNDINIPTLTKLQFFRETRHSYGRTAVLLSGGASMGLYHSGVLRALKELDMFPQIFSGSSVGSVFCALVGTRTDAELQSLGELDEQEKAGVRYDYFPQNDGPISSTMRKLKRYMATGVFMDINILRDCLQHNIGDYTFQEAYDKFGKIINIAITSEDLRHEPMLCNYLTTPTVLIWSASCASCAIPGMVNNSTVV